MSYQKVDLNLFALFEAVMKHRSVIGASRELGVTASAVSHGLARLRKVLGDELFIAGPDGMQPTARAFELAPNIQDGLGKIALALEQRSFHPAETARTFVIASTDYATTIILPQLVSRMVTEAPYSHLKIFPSGRLDVVQQLEEGRVNLVMGWFHDLPKYIRRQALLTEYEAIVVRAGHPLANGVLTKEQLLRFPHVVVEITGSEHQGNEGFVDDRGVARRVWIERLLIETGDQYGSVGRVAVTVPRYADVPLMIGSTDMVATLPRRLALRAAERDGLVVLDLPCEPLVVAHEMIWHERALADPGLCWLIGQVEAAAKELPNS